MDFMTIFNLISGVCSIIGLCLAIFVANKVYQISKTIEQKAKADNSSKIQQAGRDLNVKR